MRFRSEWLTAFTLTALAAYAMLGTKSSVPQGNAEPVTTADIDHTPVGTTRALKHRSVPRP